MTDHPLTETAAAEMYGTDEEGHTLYAWPNPERAWVVRAMGAAFDAGQKYQDDLEDDTIRSIMKDVHHLRVERDAADNAVADLAKIAGQKPVVTKARKAIAGFKIREGYPIGCMVTLRGVRMYEFLDRLITVALPRVRDFRGVSGRSFDGRGNYNFGVKEQIMFPEIEYDKVDALRGLNISITTTAKTDEEAKALLSAFRFPFRN